MTTLASPQTPAETVREMIERLAYEKYLARGAVDGFDVQDWLEAEAEILNSPAAQGQEGQQRAEAGAN